MILGLKKDSGLGVNPSLSPTFSLMTSDAATNVPCSPQNDFTSRRNDDFEAKSGAYGSFFTKNRPFGIVRRSAPSAGTKYWPQPL